MGTKWTLLKTIQQEPENRLACYAMADLLEEDGWPDLSFCYRWMGWYDRRPGRRIGDRLRKRFVWYKESSTFSYYDPEAERYQSLPHARLPVLLFQALETTHSGHQLFPTWEQAVKELARGLARLRALVSPPPERTDG